MLAEDKVGHETYFEMHVLVCDPHFMAGDEHLMTDAEAALVAVVSVADDQIARR
jgi:archaeosine-15-forming tRNA-guanine transglycosylase